MKRLLIGVLAATVVGLVGAPVAQADHCDPPGMPCHEFDWAIPHYDAFERHGIGYLAVREGIPLIDRADGLCTGRYTAAEVRSEFSLTTTETRKVVEAMADVCPEVAP